MAKELKSQKFTFTKEQILNCKVSADTVEVADNKVTSITGGTVFLSQEEGDATVDKVVCNFSGTLYNNGDFSLQASNCLVNQCSNIIEVINAFRAAVLEA